MAVYDLVIIGAGPGGLACAIKAVELGLNYALLEKGARPFQGIVDSYPKGKKVFPTIPKDETGPYPIPGLEPGAEHPPIEEYLETIEKCIARHRIDVTLMEEFQELAREQGQFVVVTRTGRYKTRNVVLAFGSNVPIDLGVYGEAKTIARTLGNPEDHIGAPTLVLGGGNAAADVVSTLSKAKRAQNDDTPVYWGHRKEHFKIDKDVARDLGEEILLGGHIKILQGAVPKIGEVDQDGVERLIIQTQQIPLQQGVQLQQGMSFPMRNVIACIGTQAPAAVFDRLGLQQITCTEGVCRIGKEGAKLIMLTRHFETTSKGIYAIGGAVSPVFMLIEEEGTLKERKHSNLIFSAVRDGVVVAEHIAGKMSIG
ncbi:NAD(P)/FAD-dependent oxidoreductase [Desulfoferrobacter suflitae]|uniref:NAD(P)/FAD-dependent oxidoreductase n=1 Tax=Desulfoferrobacter suflitae TaxID=2865782 RepID=UPI002164B59C|nr:NAD(P)/FAD-dependent oxidoreductase [Desulfoferrobacter suflitae]MCK8603724.1 NAD(P)/FAD-dependent oxidoreductase [Desulfoferrobacter suflitae]